MKKSLDEFEIRPDPTTGLHGNLKKDVFLDRIFFILIGNDDIHESLDDFEMWSDQTTCFYGNR